MDQTPQYADSDTPYAIWGFSVRGSLMILPFSKQESAGGEAFLATSPDTLMTKTLVPVSGFR